MKNISRFRVTTLKTWFFQRKIKNFKKVESYDDRAKKYVEVKNKKKLKELFFLEI